MGCFVETVGWLALLALAAGIVMLVLFLKQDADGGVYNRAVPAKGFEGKTVVLVGASSGSE